MNSNSDFGSISFDLPKNKSNVIKVIGVGGGGSNAINHMFKQGIDGVDFIVCNTDSQALQNSSVPNKIQLGVSLTEGLGAGANPEIGQQSAIESVADIEKMLDYNTKMIFITAGMGGGTGTGAAPVIAQLAREKDILTVGIVTIPFLFEGKIRQAQAIAGIEKLRKHVDSLIVINNNKLREVYGNLGFSAGYSKADEVLATAARGIAEVITHHYTQNIDLKDVKTVLANSGTAIMGSATAIGENRGKDAIISALDSPLLNDNKISGAKNVLLLIVSGNSEITIDEIGEINDHIQAEAGFNSNIIMGVGEDPSLGDAVSVTIIATGFDVEQQNEIVNVEPKKIIHSLGDDQKIVHDLMINSANVFQSKTEEVSQSNSEKIVFELIEEEVKQPAVSTTFVNENELIAMNDFIRNLDVTFEIISPISDIDFHFKSQFQQKPQQKIATPKNEIQNQFTFELPFETPVAPVAKIKEEQGPIYFELSPETKEIKVVEHIEFVPVTELSNDGIIKYSLEEYMEIENGLIHSKPAAKIEQTIEPSLDIVMKVEENQPSSTSNSNHFDEISPIEMTIEQTLKIRADERRRKLKDFNYKFHSSSKIDELEKIPAYKRTGIDISTHQAANTNSRMSLGIDSNDDVQLRSNNSFLHDNVD